jgi:hypothetical protein
MELKDGWLERQFDANAIEIATWPKSLRHAAGFTDVSLTPKQKREAARRLLLRAAELDPFCDMRDAEGLLPSESLDRIDGYIAERGDSE